MRCMNKHEALQIERSDLTAVLFYCPPNRTPATLDLLAQEFEFGPSDNRDLGDRLMAFFSKHSAEHPAALSWLARRFDVR